MKKRLSESRLVEIISEAVINETSGSYNLPSNRNRCVLQETINRMGSNYLNESINRRNYYCEVATIALAEGYITRFDFLSMLNEAAGRLFSTSNSRLLREGKEYEIVYDSLLLEEVGQRILSEYQFGDITRSIGRGIGHAYNAGKSAVNWVGDTAKKAYNAGKDAVNWVGDKASQAYQGAKDFVNNAVDTVGRWAKQGYQAVANFATQVKDTASKAVVAAWQKLGAACKAIGNGIVKVIDGAGKLIGYIMNGAAYAAFALVGLGIMAVQAAYQGVVKGLQAIGCLARKVAEGTWEIISKTGKFIGKVANKAVQLGKDGIKAVAGLPGEFVKGFESTQQGQQMVQQGLIKSAGQAIGGAVGRAAQAAAGAAGQAGAAAGQAGAAAGQAGATAGQAGAAGAGTGAAGGKGQWPMKPGRYIQQLQQALNNAGYNAGAVDGIAGPKTMAAAREAGVNPNTWKPGNPIKPKAQA